MLQELMSKEQPPQLAEQEAPAQSAQVSSEVAWPCPSRSAVTAETTPIVGHSFNSLAFNEKRKIFGETVGKNQETTRELDRVISGLDGKWEKGGKLGKLSDNTDSAIEGNFQEHFFCGKKLGNYKRTGSGIVVVGKMREIGKLSDNTDSTIEPFWGNCRNPHTVTRGTAGHV